MTDYEPMNRDSRPSGGRLGETLAGLQAPPPEEDQLGVSQQLVLSAELARYLRSLAQRVGSISSFGAGGERLQTPLDLVYVPLPIDHVVGVRVEAERLVDAWIEPASAELSDAPEDDGYELKATPGAEAPDWLAERARRAVEEQEIGGSLPTRRRPLISAPTWYDGTKHSFMRLDGVDAVALAETVVIAGPPGSGKSTVVRYVTHSLCNWLLDREPSSAAATFRASWPTQAPDRIPLHIDLRQLFSHSEFEDVSKTPTVKQLTSILSNDLDLDIDLRQELLACELPTLWVLDGVDEIPLPLGEDGLSKRIRQIRSLIAAVRAEYDDAVVVLTCRDYALKAWELDDFRHFTLASLTNEDAEMLLTRLCQQRGIDAAQLDAEVGRVLAAIREVPAALRDYPLFLSLMAAIYWDDDEGGGLPHTRAALYQRAIDLLLDRWTHDESDEPLVRRLNCTRDDLIVRLEGVAFATHSLSIEDSNETPDINFSTLLVELFRMGNTVDVHRVLAYLSEHSGVLVARDPEVFAFAHRGFQEYLAGSHLKREAESRLQRGGQEAFPSVVDLLASDPLLWREPLLLMAESIVEGSRPDDIWILVGEMIESVESSDTDHERWWAGWLVAKIFYQQDLIDRVSTRDRHLVARVGASARRLLESGALTAAARCDAAMALGVIGDDRAGVGLDDNGIPDIALIPVSAGRPRLGTTDDDRARLDSAIAAGWGFGRESPAYEVELSDYMVAAVPITVGQFNAFLYAPDGYGAPDWWSPEALQWRDGAPERPMTTFRALDNHPVVNVSWYESVAFCSWLSVRLGRPIRLPTEPEWENAARNGDVRLFSWGDHFSPERCNCKESGFGQPVPVGCYPTAADHTNTILDLSGNIWEWCSTAAVDGEGAEFSYPYSPTDGREGLELGPLAYRIVRGGSFVNPPFLVRCAYRGRDRPGERASRIGFRVATYDLP